MFVLYDLWQGGTTALGPTVALPIRKHTHVPYNYGLRTCILSNMVRVHSWTLRYTDDVHTYFCVTVGH